MGFFKRKNTTAASPTVSAPTPTPAPTTPQVEQPPPFKIYEFFGDIELITAAAKLQLGSWKETDEILNARPGDEWSEQRLYDVGATVPDVVELWAAEEPTSRSLTFLGASQIEAAWDVRGSGPGSTVGLGSALSFRQILALADETLVKAAELDSTDAAPWMLRVTAGMGLGKNQDELRSLFDEAHRRKPFIVGGVSRMTQALAEKWGGSEEALIGFAKWIDNEAPAGHPAHMALPAAIHECAFVDAFRAKQADPSAHFLLEYMNATKKFEDDLLDALSRLLDAMPNPVAEPGMVRTFNLHFYHSDVFNERYAALLPRLLTALDNRSIGYPWGHLSSVGERQEFEDRQQRTITLLKLRRDHPDRSDKELAAMMLATERAA